MSCIPLLLRSFYRPPDKRPVGSCTGRNHPLHLIISSSWPVLLIWGDQRNLKESHHQISAPTFNLKGVGRGIGCLTPSLITFSEVPGGFHHTLPQQKGNRSLHLPQPNHSTEQFSVLDFTGSEWSRDGLPNLIHSHNILKQRFKTCLNQLNHAYQNTPNHRAKPRRNAPNLCRARQPASTGIRLVRCSFACTTAYHKSQTSDSPNQLIPSLEAAKCVPPCAQFSVPCSNTSDDNACQWCYPPAHRCSLSNCSVCDHRDGASVTAPTERGLQGPGSHMKSNITELILAQTSTEFINQRGRTGLETGMGCRGKSPIGNIEHHDSQNTSSSRNHFPVNTGEPS